MLSLTLPRIISRRDTLKSFGNHGYGKDTGRRVQPEANPGLRSPRRKGPSNRKCSPKTTSQVDANILTPLQESRSLFPPGPTELQVAVRSTGLCGSDLHYYGHFRNGDIIVKEPMSLGHESAGVVVGVGSGVMNFSVGDKVALEVGLPCEQCDRCKEGRYNICKGMNFRSSAKAFPHAQGTLQDRINHPAAWCHK